MRSLERRLREYAEGTFDHNLFADLISLTEPPLAIADIRAEPEILGYSDLGVF